MATIDELGAAVTTLNEYLEQFRQSYRDIDEAWNIEPESPDGLQIAAWVEALANLDEQLINAYRSVDPDTAIGEQLDRIMRLSGLTRQLGTFSTATVTFSGVNGTTIPAGTEVRNEETDTLWATDTEAEIAGGVATVNVTCTTRGSESAAIGDLSVIATPVAGVSSVTNDAAASLGRDTESDVVARERRNLSMASPGSNQVDTTFGRVSNVEEVKYVRIYENVTASTDANGLDPHSMAIFVDGGDTVDVAEAIANTKSPGCGFNAANTFPNKVQEQVETEEGSPLLVTFYRPELVSIFVEVTIDAAVNTATEEAIKQSIVDYAMAELFGSGVSGFDKTGFGIGEPVPAGKLYTPVNRTIGTNVAATNIQLGTTAGSVNQSKITLDLNELSSFDVSNITVLV